MNILLAVDGSVYTKKMLAYLAANSYLEGGVHQYTVITVQPALPARARAAVGKEVLSQYYSEEAQKVMEPVCKYLAQHGVTPQRVIKVGAVGEERDEEVQVVGRQRTVEAAFAHEQCGNVVV